VSSNSSSSPSGLSVANGVSCTVANSIITGNSGNNVGGPVTNRGVNLTSGDPMLYPLGNHGGCTFTMPPRPHSPAIDAIANVTLALPTTPLAYWRLGEEDTGAANGQPTITTSNRLNVPLKFNSSATYTAAVSPIAAGWLGSRLGLGFTTGTYGTNGLITSLDGSTALTDNFGIELWVKPQTLSGNQCLAYNGNTGGGGSGGWGLYLIGNQYHGLFGGVDLVGAATATAGVWTHLALVRNNGIATLYVNGVASGASAATPNVPLGRFAVGAQPQSLAAEFFAGALDEVRVFTFAPGQFNPGSLSYQPTQSVGYSLPPTEGESRLDSAWSLDQRGFPRVANGAADIGAVEVQESVVRLTDNAGNGSLRQVLDNVIAPGIVTFAPALSGRTITLTSGELALNSTVTIDASSLSSPVSLNGNNASRIFNVGGGVSVMLNSLVITNARIGSGNWGGAIANNGTLTLNNCTLAGNSVDNTSYGGAINNAGTLTLTGCTLSGNRAAYAGAINNNSVCNAWNCTFYGNAALAGNGGAIDNSFSATLSLIQCTFVGNSVTGGAGGAIDNYLSQVNIANSIIANNTGGDIYNWSGSTIAAGGLNIVRVLANAGGTVVGAGTMLAVNPLLGPLANYGGPTQTMPPLPGSPAIDAGNNSAASGFPTDQRGFSRVVNGIVDIGAVEGVFDPAFPLVYMTTPGSGNVQFTFNNLSGLSFTVLASTNVAAPLNTWAILGPAVEASPGTFRFTDTQATNYPQRFYQVRGP
jgi:hypothetical protein